MESVSIEKAVPKSLLQRMYYRQMSLIATCAFIFLSLIFAGVGVLFIISNSNIYHYTAMTITDFWNFHNENGIKAKEVPLMATFSGIFLIGVAVIDIMNFIVILKHLIRGGLKMRLSFFNYIVIIIHVILLGYSLIPFIKHGGMLWLNWAILILGGLGIINASFLFYLLHSLIKVETPYLLSIQMIKKHKNEFIDDYVKNSRGNMREMYVDNNHDAVINRNTMS